MAPPGRAPSYRFPPSWRRFFPAFGALVCASLAGCAWVGPGAIEEKLDSLDHDGDGAPYGGPPGVRDCDDFDPNVAPGLPEIPYDGLDNDCGGDGDLIDIDGDGYAGISREAYLKLFPDAVWPAHLPPDLVDCVDDPEAHPMARHIHPKASDAPYDGVDADCAGDDDFDADADGYLPDQILRDGEWIPTGPARESYAEEWGLDLAEPVFGDCNDLDARVNPGVDPADDVPYDGDDSDCDGSNDFDLDGDGFMPEGPGFDQAYERFVQTYHQGDPPWGEARWGDCLDAPRPAGDLLEHVDPATVHPDAEEIPYDGIDSDCDGSNDFDADGDGFMPDIAPGYPNHEAFAQAFRDHLDAWQTNHPEVWGDCDDSEPQALPGGFERWGDGIDGDCDGHPDTALLFDAGHTWTAPLPPVLVATDLHYVLTTAAVAVDLAAPLGVRHEEVGLSLTFPRTAGASARPAEHLVWQFAQQPPHTIHPAVDAVSTGDGFWVALALHGPTNAYVRARRHTWNPLTSTHQPAPSVVFNGNTGPDIGSLDLVVDGADQPWVVACEPTRAWFGRGASSVQTLHQRNPGASTCVLGDAPAAGQPAIVHTCDAGGCERLSYDAASGQITPLGPSSLPGAIDARSRDGWFQLVDAQDGGWLVRQDGAVKHRLFRGAQLSSLDAIWHDDLIWTAAVVFDPGLQRDVVKVGWADPTVDQNGDGAPDLHTVDWPIGDPSVYTPLAVALLADADRLVVAVTMAHASDPEAERVAWAFVGW